MHIERNVMTDFFDAIAASVMTIISLDYFLQLNFFSAVLHTLPEWMSYTSEIAVWVTTMCAAMWGVLRLVDYAYEWCKKWHKKSP